MRASHPVLVIAITFGAVLGLAGFGALKQASSNHRAIVQALRYTMERAYDQVMAEMSPSEGGQQSRPSTEALRSVLLKPDHQVAILPSFVSSRDVFLPLRQISIPSDDLFCVVRLDEGNLYGITGRRQWRVVSRHQFDAWPHQPLSTNGLIRRP